MILAVPVLILATVVLLVIPIELNIDSFGRHGRLSIAGLTVWQSRGARKRTGKKQAALQRGSKARRPGWLKLCYREPRLIYLVFRTVVDSSRLIWKMRGFVECRLFFSSDDPMVNGVCYGMVSALCRVPRVAIDVNFAGYNGVVGAVASPVWLLGIVVGRGIIQFPWIRLNAALRRHA